MADYLGSHNGSLSYCLHTNLQMAFKEATCTDLIEALDLVAEEVAEYTSTNPLLVFSELVDGIEASYAVA